MYTALYTFVVHTVIYSYYILLLYTTIIIYTTHFIHCQISDPFVRAYAIQQLYILDDNELADILLQLVQVCVYCVYT